MVSSGSSLNRGGDRGPLKEGRELPCGHTELGAEPPSAVRLWPWPWSAFVIQKKDPRKDRGRQWWEWGARARASPTKQPLANIFPWLELEPHSIPWIGRSWPLPAHHSR